MWKIVPMRSFSDQRCEFGQLFWGLSRSEERGLWVASPLTLCEGACMAKLKAPPAGAGSIQKGSSLAEILSPPALRVLAENLRSAHPAFAAESFVREAARGLGGQSLFQRSHQIAAVLRSHLPERYEEALEILMNSMPSRELEKNLGLGVFFYLPHSQFIANYGLDAEGNGGRDPFMASMLAQRELTQRFTAEFSVRPFLIREPERSLKLLKQWVEHESEHVRRWCSEGSRPRLPWGMRIPALIQNPRPTRSILEALKDDSSLYVRRSVANHLGDVAKDNLDLALEWAEAWLKGASPQRLWVIRHALRYPAKKSVPRALKLRKLAKPLAAEAQSRVAQPKVRVNKKAKSLRPVKSRVKARTPKRADG